MDLSFTGKAGEAIAEIKRLSEERGQIVVAMDGRCAAGKTTLAQRLGERYGWSVVHADDFFLRPEQRTAERLDTPGENIDHERLLAEALLPAKSGQAFSYRPFDCQQLALGEPVFVKPASVLLVEGAYSCHPSLWGHYDLRLFLDIDAEEQKRRILARNGWERGKIFQEKWIPLEERYIAEFQIDRRCDFAFRFTSF